MPTPFDAYVGGASSSYDMLLKQASDAAFGKTLQALSSNFQGQQGPQPPPPQQPGMMPPPPGMPGPPGAAPPPMGGQVPPGASQPGGPPPMPMRPPMAAGPPGAMPPPPGGMPPPQPVAAPGGPPMQPQMPMGGGPPGMGGQPQPTLDWRVVLQKVQQANPGAPPQVLAGAVDRFIPLMNQQSQMQWREFSLQMREQGLEIAQQRADTTAQSAQDRGGMSLERINLQRMQLGLPPLPGGSNVSAMGSQPGGQFSPQQVQGAQPKERIAGESSQDSTTPSPYGLPKGSALDIGAETYYQTGKLPPNTGRGIQGRAASNAYIQRATELHPEDPVANWPNRWRQFATETTGMRTLENRFAQLTLADKESQTLLPRVRQASEKVDRTKYPDLNRIIEAGKTKTGDASVIRLGIAAESLKYVYARILKPVGVLNQNDIENASHILNIAWSKGQINQALDQIEIEREAAKKGLENARQVYRGGGGKEKAPDDSAPQQTEFSGRFQGLPQGWSVEQH